MRCPLELEGWRAFNRFQWNVTPVRLRNEELDVFAYRDARGRYVLPPMNPHWPVFFAPSGITVASRRQHQWMTASEFVVEEMLACGVHGSVALPPEIGDPRPWHWAGFRVTPLFTFYIDFPYAIGSAHSNVRKSIRRALRCGLTVRRTESVDDVLGCLRETEERQKFNLHLTRKSLEYGLRVLGDEAFRFYVCYAPNGEPACARIVLHTPGARACGLVAATRYRYRSEGANQLSLAHVLDDLQQAGATGFNFCGANMQSVSAAKARFGGRLVPHYEVETFGYAPLKRAAGRLLRLLRHQSAARRSQMAEQPLETLGSESCPAGDGIPSESEDRDPVEPCLLPIGAK